MKTTITSIAPSGYGHKKITIQYMNGKEYSAITSCMPLTDAYRSDCYTQKEIREQKRAEKALIRLVKNAHNLR